MESPSEYQISIEVVNILFATNTLSKGIKMNPKRFALNRPNVLTSRSQLLSFFSKLK